MKPMFKNKNWLTETKIEMDFSFEKKKNSLDTGFQLTNQTFTVQGRQSVRG